MINILKTDSFLEVVNLITSAKERTFTLITKTLLQLYRDIGEFVSTKISENSWGKSTVEELSLFIKNINPKIKGFTSRNICRMKQFYETYNNDEKLTPLVTELGWSKNLLILSDEKMPKLLKDLPQNVTGVFKDSYVLDFLDLPKNYKEKDLQSALVANLKKFILELGMGFSFIWEKVRLEVGNSNFELDLLFYHRDLQCMVVFELKTGEFKPSHLGQLSFCIEALDKEQKRPHENPTIGILLCRSKDNVVVELALNSSISPTLISEYETKLIPKDLLRQKMNEFYNLLESKEEEL